jgi:secreted trypsin-like serine protease
MATRIRAKVFGTIAGAAVLAGTIAAAAFGVVGGTADAGRHPYVGAAERAVNGGFELCSGSLVSATVFVTAAHCFPEGSTVQVSFADDVSPGSGATWYAGTVHHEPGFCLGCGNGLPGGDTNDLAVVVLAGAGAPQAQGRYAQLPPPGLVDALPNNQLLSVVGYGVQSFQPPQTPVAFGTRQIASIKVINGGGKVGGEFLKHSGDPAQGMGGQCFGDSGGPDLLPGTDTMVAVTAFGTGNPICGGASYSERLDRASALAFIVNFL